MTQLTNALHQIAGRSDVPLSTRNTARSLEKRLLSGVQVCIVSSDSKTSAPVTERLVAVESPRLVVHHQKTTLPIDTSFDLLIAIPSDEDMDEIANCLRATDFAAERTALWHKQASAFEGSVRFAFISHSQNAEEIITWTFSRIASALEADETTAIFLAEKWCPGWDRGESHLESKTEIAPENPQDILSWCLQKIEELTEALRPSLPLSGQQDLDTAHDQVVLLELEGTPSAAATALRIMVQIRDEIEKLGTGANALSLPNLKPSWR